VSLMDFSDDQKHSRVRKEFLINHLSKFLVGQMHTSNVSFALNPPKRPGSSSFFFSFSSENVAKDIQIE
jgi:hypothetical protein